MARILAVTNFYPPHHYGGYELTCRDVLERFAARGHDVSVLTSAVRLPDAADPPAGAGVVVDRSLRLYWADHRLLRPSLPARLRVERHNQRRLAAALAAARPDVVSVWNMGALSFGLLATLAERRVPVVANVHDDWLDYGPRLDAWIRLFLARPAAGRLVRRLTGVPTALPDLDRLAAYCFVSEATRRHASTRTRWRFPVSAVVGNGVDPADFPVAAQGGRPWSWRLLYVGRLDGRKGVDTAVAALARLPEQATLTVVGRGDADYLARLHALTRTLGVDGRVSFTTVERAGLAAVYTAADACVFPSRWAEPFGLVPLEAMACATPVVATGTGGSAEFLRDGGNCLLFPPGEDAALAAALTRLAGDPALRAALVAGGRRTAAELTVDRLADVLEDWHLAAAAGFPSGPPAPRPPSGLTGGGAAPPGSGR